MFRTAFSAALLALSMFSAPSIRAQQAPGGGTPTVHDCSSTGCHVVTCSGSNGSMVFCSNGNCVFVTSFRKPASQEKSTPISATPSQSTRFAAGQTLPGVAIDGPVGVNTCSETRCNQLVVHTSGVIRAGSSENPSYTLRRALQSEGARR